MSMENPRWVDGQKSILEQKSMSMEEEKDTSWEERFDEEFDCVMWWGCYNKDGSQKHGYETDCGDELKSFIRQEREAAKEEEREKSRIEREALLREVSELIKKKEREIPKAKKGDYDAMLANLNQQHINIGYNQAITEVQNIIKNKI